MKNALEIQDVESLKLRFPLMFAGSVISMDFYKGWFTDFVRLCCELDALLGEERHRFHWVQLKEKFGSYEMYFSFSWPSKDENDEGFASMTALRERVRSAVERCAVVMDHKCCVCGDLGTKRTDTPWVATLCDYHDTDARCARGDTRPVYELTAVPKFPGDGGGGATP